MGARTAKRLVRCLVFDLGAGSGRAMLAELGRDARLAVEEIDRFEGLEIAGEDGPRWDLPALLDHVERGLARAKAVAGTLDSIGVDGWGLDYALLDADGRALAAPHHYRHPRSRRGYESFPLAPAEVFRRTGAQVLPIDTLFQVADEARAHPERLGRARALLMMADVVNHHLTGLSRSEATLARTSALLDLDGGGWNAELSRAAGLPPGLLQPLVRPGEIYGHLKPALAGPLGWPAVPVVAVAAHDTASAVAGLPLGADEAFLICGSWSLVGAEQERPSADPALFEAGFGTEGGAGGRTFLVKSINGLHLVRRLRTAWSRRTGRDLAFADIAAAVAALAPDAAPPIDPADPLFFDPPDVVDAIGAHFAARGIAPPRGLGALALSIYRGLGAAGAQALRVLERRRGAPFARIRLCGGGAQDRLFCDLVAAETGRPVRVGPVEASAWGNAAMQLVGLGRVASLGEARAIVAASADFRDHRPPAGP